mmetsp:Transcript_5883/g.8776  ORF Transcript_5883/g.8776 Transcript_5883/m.8776 type:complete len:168 (+) Transcript_5883:1-504(+)
MRPSGNRRMHVHQHKHQTPSSKSKHRKNSFLQHNDKGNNYSKINMKTTVLTLLSSLAFASGFAPGAIGRHASPLFMSDEELQTGTVKWFDTQKGYGFILPDDDSADVFVHQTKIKVEGFRSLAEGERVEYKIVTEGGKKKAMDVTGPDGTDVKGAPYNANDDFDDDW